MKNSLSLLSRIIALTCSLSLIIVLFLPVWRIELSAPQFPEGLTLKIYANRLGGNVDDINTLNRYIGMQTLHEKNFAEFKILPYIIVAFIIFGQLVAFFNRKWIFFTWISIYMLFAVSAVIDFYQMGFKYGNYLDPAAPFGLRGISYQPPLIGHKQLSEFSTRSIPDYGGWILINVGLLLTAAAFIEIRKKGMQPRQSVKR
jgi:copper chaperone NosL